MQYALSLGFVGIYVLLFGIATFLQKPALKDLDALQLNACTAVGLAIISVVAVALRDRQLPSLPHFGLGLGIGLLMGIGSVAYFLGLRHLPVSIAASLSMLYIVVTVALSVIFLHEVMTVPRVAGIVLAMIGIMLLAF